MLLRRFIEHLKDQNWTAVGLDFVIVVLGVFIGIQVSNWNDARRDVALARNYLERLTVDATKEISDCDHMLERIAAKRAGLERIAAVLDAQDRGDPSDALDEYGPQFLIDIRRSTNFAWFTQNVHSPTYEEMISSGRLTLIRDAAMREFIVGYYARRHVQTSRTANRISGYGNMMYRHAPPQLMAIDQLASDGEILAAMSSLDAKTVMARFHDDALSPYVNAELSFAYFLEREVRENRVAAEEFRTALRTYLDTGEVTITEWDPIG
jgi:hypothetical protein